MASLDQMPAQSNGQTYDSDDVELAVRLGIKLIREGGGLKLMADAINQSQDPARVVGQFLGQLMGKLAEVVRDKYGIDPGIFVAKNGWLDTILDWIEGELGYPSDFSDKVYGQVMELIKAAAMEPPPANNEMGGQVVVAPTPTPSQDPSAMTAASQQGGGY